MSLPHYHQFKAYCESKNVQLLPDDVAYLDVKLKRHSLEETREILKHYVDEWVAGVNSEGLSQKKQNTGRVKANAWLQARLNIAEIPSPGPPDTTSFEAPPSKQPLSKRAANARTELLNMVNTWRHKAAE